MIILLRFIKKIKLNGRVKHRSFECGKNLTKVYQEIICMISVQVSLKPVSRSY